MYDHVDTLKTISQQIKKNAHCTKGGGMWWRWRLNSIKCANKEIVVCHCDDDTDYITRHIQL